MSSSILEEYKKKHSKSLAHYQEAQTLNPDGVTHEVRYLLPFPLYMDHGSGPRKWDVDGNEYVGYVMGHGALILGHCHPAIVEEVNNQIVKGTHLGFNTVNEIRWTKAIKALMPSIEKVRFHSSGTEATLMAFRLSRAYTGKSKILKFSNHFHGWQDYAAVSGGTYGCAGVPQKTVETVEVLDPGNIDAVEQLIKKDGDIAAIILEPTGAKGGALPVKPEFLQELRDVTQRHGVVLIFDEVVTGFRTGSGGAQKKYGITPDLTTLAKIVAGGFPGGAVGGKAEIVDMIKHRDDEQWNKTKRVAHPGTYNANPMSAVVGSRCLEIIAKEPINERAEKTGLELRDTLNDIIKRKGIHAFVHGYGAMAYLVWGVDYDGDRGLCTAPHAKLLGSLESETTKIFRRAMLNNGVDVMSGHQFILSATHGKKELDDTAAAFETSLDQMKAEGLI